MPYPPARPTLPDRGRDVAQPAARPRRRDPRRQRRLGRLDQRRVAGHRRADRERDRRVAHPAVQRRPGVHAEQVARLKAVGTGDAVQRRVVHRRADDRRVRDRRELRVVVQERRGRPRLGEHVPGGPIEFLEGDPRRGGAAGGRQHVGHHPAGPADRVDLARRLDLDHGQDDSGCRRAAGRVPPQPPGALIRMVGGLRHLQSAIIALCMECWWAMTDGLVGARADAVDAVLVASRALVAVATKSLRAAAEVTTITQYRCSSCWRRGARSGWSTGRAAYRPSPAAMTAGRRLDRPQLGGPPGHAFQRVAWCRRPPGQREKSARLHPDLPVAGRPSLTIVAGDELGRAVDSTVHSRRMAARLRRPIRPPSSASS